jgi:hypothetical protein
MEKITLDFTGLFYEIDIPLKDLPKDPTVKDVTLAAVGKNTTHGGNLFYATFDNQGFLSSAFVIHADSPKSRQKNTAGNPKPADGLLPVGIYGYDDTYENNNVPGIQVSFSLAWQYYIFRDGKLISGKTSTSTDRVIVPASESNIKPETKLQDGDIVRWKLVAIGGLYELIESKMAKLSPEKKDEFMARVLEEKMTVRGIARELDLFE